MISHKRNTGIALDDDCFTNSEDRVLLAKLGYTISLEEYTGLEKTSEVLDVYRYIEKVAGIPGEVARAVDRNEAFSGEYLKDMNYNVPEDYEVKGDLCVPIEKEAEATHELKSSNIKAVGYDKENKTLEVAFHSGGNYTYKGIPKSLFDRIKKVKSPGKFFHKHIKKKVEEYPYNKIEKKATTLSATKNLLRQMQAQGIKLVRTPEQVFNAQNAAALRDKGKSLQELRPDLTRKKLLNRAKWVLEDHAGAYAPNLQAVIIPRQKYTIHNPRMAEIAANSPFSAMNVRLGHEPSTVPNTFSPRAGLFHEYGHAQHHLDDPKAFGKYRTSNPEALFAQERIANNNALLFMRQNNVPQSHIENYIHNTAPAYASYLKAFSRGSTKYYDPATYYSPHSLDTSSWYTK